MLALLILIVVLLGGWLGWSFWWSIPLGYAMFAASFVGRRDAALQHAKSAWLVAPVTALFFMWVAWGIHRLIG